MASPNLLWSTSIISLENEEYIDNRSLTLGDDRKDEEQRMWRQQASYQTVHLTKKIQHITPTRRSTRTKDLHYKGTSHSSFIQYLIVTSISQGTSSTRRSLTSLHYLYYIIVLLQNTYVSSFNCQPIHLFCILFSCAHL